MIRKNLFLFILLLSGVLDECKAQTYVGVSIPVTISEVLDLNISPSTTHTFSFSTTGQIDAGIQSLATHTLTYRSNKDWYITIKATATGSNFSGGNTNFPMPISFLKYKLSNSNTYLPFSTSPQFLTGTAASNNLRGTGTIVVDFFMDPGYIGYPAQDYTVTITYNIEN